MVRTWTIYSSFVAHLLCIWCGKYLVEGVRRDPVWEYIVLFFFSLFICTVCAWNEERMDIIWEILIILQVNFIVCISGEL